MSGTGPIVTLSPRDYDAVLFDLDGVLTQTATVHAAAWKRLFDDFLSEHAARSGEEFVPFDIKADYLQYVDGKPRYDGVANFLASRGIELPLGNPADGPDERTVHGLGNRKDGYFNEHLKRHGVLPYEPSIELVRSLRKEDIRTAVVSSSNNCAAVLDAIGIAHLFEVRVDGIDVTRLGLRGKPAPDAFNEAARRLRVEPSRSVVVEDAISGVAAGRAGGFRLVIGVDRLAQSQALREAGAHIVVTSLDQVQVAAEPVSAWSLQFEGFDPAREGMRESLCALGNGYFETRGAALWSQADGIHYPGTYIAGAYNRLQTHVAGRTVENEDLVNFPNWLSLKFAIGDDWFDERTVNILSYRQELDLRHGTLLKSILFEDSAGRRTTLAERRLVSMADMHMGAVELTLTASNWSGSLTVCSAIDGRIVNSGARLYREFNNMHLEQLESMATDEDVLCLEVRTSQSRLQVAQAVRTRVLRNGSVEAPPRKVVEEPAYVAHEFTVELEQDVPLVLEKVLAMYTSRDHAISEAGIAACKAIARAGSYDDLLRAHVLAWMHNWRRFDIHVRPSSARFNLNVPMLLRLNILHLLQAVSLNSIGLDIGVPARGWTGEAYQGHIFWDELFIFPFLTFRTPEITRSLLMYRYRRLNEARAAAKDAGFEGAMFPWQSGSDGQEETQELNLNHRSRRWIPDNSWLQRHVGSAVAYNVWNYFQITYDTEFLQFYGAELILEIARFWSSAAHLNEQTGRYEINGIMGPDEFHEGYPDSPVPGLKNNAYTNIMAAWVLCRGLEVLEVLPETRRSELVRSLGLTEEETSRWQDISRRLFVPFHENGIISQFEGYEKLAELDWSSYRLRYGNIQRLDLILEAENDTGNRYKMNKQADVLMLFYLFSAKQLAELFERLGYPFEYDTIPKNVDYYDARSTHGSTLSRVVHSWVLARSDRPRAMKYFAEALQSDVADIQQGTTAEGIHLGAMAGTVDLLQRVTTGIEVSGDVLRLDPQLPRELERIDMRVRYRGHALDLRITSDTLTIRGRERGPAPVNLAFRDDVFAFDGLETRVFDLATANESRSRRAGTG
ncbi:MAG TPA: beta-phosphoglucomutase family hydrolase [Woeseiaceae bacterium]|nr:beta-phosphoglucomutase family hydrolase [Woeseiaceae bacterium]